MEKEKTMQQIHKDCGGEIILMSLGDEIKLMCKDCKMFWGLNIGTMTKSEDWCDVPEQEQTINN
jgi:hypothetical protein